MCPNCNAPIRADSEYCTNCGVPVRPSSASGAPTTQPAPPSQPVGPYQAPPPSQPMRPYQAPSPSQLMGPPHAGAPGPGTPAPGWSGPATRPGTPPFRFDLKRLATPDLVIGGATAVVLISLFLPWFGIFGASTSGFSLHGYLVIALLVDLALLGYLVLRAGWDTTPVKLPIAHAPLLLVGTGVQLLFVLIAFLQPDGLAHEFGSYLALLAALVACGVIAVPAIRSVLDTPRGGAG
jgi:zinc-ribbon domain